MSPSEPPNQVAALPPGSDVVDWLYHNVEGFTDRREARKYASNLLKAGFIRHTVNKITFSEQCYYIFGDLCGSTCLSASLPCLLAGSGEVIRNMAADQGVQRRRQWNWGLSSRPESSVVEVEPSLASSPALYPSQGAGTF